MRNFSDITTWNHDIKKKKVLMNMAKQTEVIGDLVPETLTEE